MFTPLMRALTPSGTEQALLAEQEALEEAAKLVPPFDPSTIEDGRKKILQSIAIRRGQSKFREKLLNAYDSQCAVTGTNVAVTLQAAHIMPYKGPATNSVQNGILLRADIHNLFDLGLLTIDPDTLVIGIVEELRGTVFASLEGSKLKVPKKASDHPSKAALTERQKMLPSLSRPGL
jgi:predicted restriction endonuclease